MLTPQQGEVIAGRYRLQRELARGGMGSVWAGKDDKLRRRVAIKLVAPDWDDASDAHERFEREAMAVAQLQSPHVVQVFDYGVERGYPYIVMELLEGEDLRSRLHKIKRISLENAAHVLVQTAKALSVAHAAGIVHRDLKPGNVFLVRAGEEEIVKVLDFGVAQNNATDLLDDKREEGVIGTPQFMSPEHARGQVVDHRSDLWSLGVIIYKALTGRLPFQGRTPTSVIVKVCTKDPESIRKLAPDLPHELEAFFDRALARDRDQRFSSAREMALAFSRISPVTFTTLSMPDPAQIEAAIRRAKDAAVQEDDEAATMAIDALTEAFSGFAIDEKTSVHLPTSLAKALPIPKPPPRRSRPRADEDEEEVEWPTSAVSATQAAAIVQAAADSMPEAVPSDPLELQTPTPSLAHMGAAESPAPSSDSGARDSDPPASRPRLSTPTLRGVVDFDSLPSEPPEEHSRPTLLLALGAVVIGVLVAFIGSAVVNGGPDSEEPPAGAAVASDGSPNGSQAMATAASDIGETERSASDEPGADEPGADEPGADEPGADEPGADEPGADEPGSGVGASTPSKPSPRKPNPVAATPPGASPPGASPPGASPPEPGPTSAPPPAPPPPAAPPPAPKPAPPSGGDPFAERL
jgi:eukaryotic-like serine/threonine-protein kinase